MIEKIGHAKKTPEVLTEVFTKLSYVLILDLPDFIQDFVLDRSCIALIWPIATTVLLLNALMSIS